MSSRSEIKCRKRGKKKQGCRIPKKQNYTTASTRDLTTAYKYRTSVRTNCDFRFWLHAALKPSSVPSSSSSPPKGCPTHSQIGPAPNGDRSDRLCFICAEDAYLDLVIAPKFPFYAVSRICRKPQHIENKRLPSREARRSGKLTVPDNAANNISLNEKERHDYHHAEIARRSKPAVSALST